MMPATASRVVLDTNTVMALWVFEDPALARLRAAVEGGELLAVTRADAVEELRRVLAYRQFGLDAASQQVALETYVARCDELGAAPPADEASALPMCRDRDDQKFLEIARDGEVALLVTRDKALLRLNRHRLLRPLFRVLTPEALSGELAAPPSAG